MSGFSQMLWLRGLGLWTTGFADPAAYVAKLVDPAVKEPRAELLPVRLRRRTGLITRMAAEVVGQAAAGSDLELPSLTLVFASVYGEIQTTLELLAQIVDEPGSPLSPAKFHNSVHNTATGYLSIATGSHLGSTSISGGAASLAYALVEAATMIRGGVGPVMVVLAEEPLPEPLAQGRVYAPLAAAFLLDAPPADRSGARLVRIAVGAATEAQALTTDAPSLTANPCATALALVAALHHGDAGAYALSPADESPFFVLEAL
ncbi:MAG: beta-ketoacyl synthase chain length factor [Nannocystis sp.]|nr:beta-ketoacyl synthase chain length factor [Nannocystis sp.]